MKYLSIIITIALVATIAGYLRLDNQTIRKIAGQNIENNQLTPRQQQKWSTTKQFQIRQTNESLLIDVPHLPDLCAENQSLIFKFSAYEISVAADNPNLQYTISCALALAKAQTQFEVLFSDLISMHQTKEKNLPEGILKSFLIYSDEQFPARWNLSEISIEGADAFKINQYEIQKVFGNNFEFELQP